MEISGYHEAIESQIRNLLRDLIPVGTTLNFEETKKTRQTGSPYDYYDMWHGELTITACSQDSGDRVLAKLVSTNESDSRTGGLFYYKDDVNYRYVISTETVLAWFPC